MRDVFELQHTDGGGRIGTLEIPRSGVTVETPALMPVINPHIETISPAMLESDFGVEILITNGYIFYQSDDYRDAALSTGLHDLFDFSGAIVTDSGSFQLASYGDISVTTPEILQFQFEIGSDVGTPVDIPTAPDVSRSQAAEELDTTLDRLSTAEELELGEMLVNAPIQGSTYTDLRRKAATACYQSSLDIFPIGAVVPLLNKYRYADIIDIISASKQGLGHDAPVHLFGAGHPMMFALGVAAGCDLFDSAAYAIYARDDRYLTVAGTEHLSELDEFPCTCSICVAHSPEQVRACDDETREELLATHNLLVSLTEIRRIKRAIRTGNLFELVDRRVRGHPTLLDGYRQLLDQTERLAQTDPVSKGTFFYTSGEAARRPEVRRHHTRLSRIGISGKHVLISEGGTNESYDETWRLKPPFGPYPPALSETYPLTAEVPNRHDSDALDAAVTGIRHLVEANPDVSFTVAHHGWPPHILSRLPSRVTSYELGSEESKEGYDSAPSSSS